MEAIPHIHRMERFQTCSWNLRFPFKKKSKKLQDGLMLRNTQDQKYFQPHALYAWVTDIPSKRSTPTENRTRVSPVAGAYAITITSACHSFPAIQHHSPHHTSPPSPQSQPLTYEQQQKHSPTVLILLPPTTDLLLPYTDRTRSDQTGPEQIKSNHLNNRRHSIVSPCIVHSKLL